VPMIFYYIAKYKDSISIFLTVLGFFGTLVWVAGGIRGSELMLWPRQTDTDKKLLEFLEARSALQGRFLSVIGGLLAAYSGLMLFGISTKSLSKSAQIIITFGALGIVLSIIGIGVMWMLKSRQLELSLSIALNIELGVSSSRIYEIDFADALRAYDIDTIDLLGRWALAEARKAFNTRDENLHRVSYAALKSRRTGLARPQTAEMAVTEQMRRPAEPLQPPPVAESATGTARDSAASPESTH